MRTCAWNLEVTIADALMTRSHLPSFSKILSAEESENMSLAKEQSVLSSHKFGVGAER
jgi:hypothetical protein